MGTRALRINRSSLQWLAFFVSLLVIGLYHQPASAIDVGSWQNVAGATVNQSSRTYLRGVGYYTDNTISLNGATPTGALRIAVTDSGLPVNNPTSVDGGIPVFMLNSASDTTRIEFQIRRARFGYTAVLQEFIEADPDSDGDGVPDADDNCPDDPNSDQQDTDGDGIGDVCDPQDDTDSDGDGVRDEVDNCPANANPNQNDIDNDGIGDVCDPQDDTDTDLDGVRDEVDNCPADANPNQEDMDNDGIGDACDLQDDTDTDLDGVRDEVDNCPADANPNQDDLDNDGIGDACDPVDDTDTDQDGIPDSEDICPDDDTNTCITITGVVFGGGATINGANVQIGTNTVNTSSNAAGGFDAGVGNDETSTNSAGMFFPLEVRAEGFSTGNVSVDYVPGQTEYEVTVTLVQVSTSVEEDDNLDEGVDITSEGEPVGSLMIPTASLPEDVTGITGDITYLDPETNDISAGPDLVALADGDDPNDPDETPVTLETFGMMDFNLQDQNGNEINELDGPAEVCMRAPDGLVENDTIPLWYYDEGIALWVEEGVGTVVNRDGQLQICGEVTHFTWWNYDQPINTHSCFRFQMKNAADGEAITGLSWYAEGVTYNGTSPQRFCNDTPVGFDSLTVKISDSPGDEQIRVYTQIEGIRYYLKRVGENDYELATGSANGTVFDTPTSQGSCLSGTRAGFCENLDYLDSSPDGMLSVDLENINLPPVISMFDLTDSVYTVLVGESTTAMATVTDPEETDVSVVWDSRCFGAGVESLTPTADGPSTSPATFSTVFTAPDSLNSLFETCEIELTATDSDGNSSVARRYLTVIGDTEFLFTGRLFGTDGNPLPFYPVDYTNFCNGANLQASALTDDQGFFQIAIDLAQCGFTPEDFFFADLGVLRVSYDVCPQSGSGFCDNWQREQPINDIFFGEYYYEDGGLNSCVTGDEITECETDIILPTLWAPLTCVYHRTDPDDNLDQLVDFYGQGIYGGGYAFDRFFTSVSGGPGTYPICPSQLPLGEMGIDVFKESSVGSNSYFHEYDMRFGVPSIEPLAQDVADSGEIRVPTVVTVFNDLGVPQPDFQIDSFFDAFYDITVQDLLTDSNGQVMFDSPLGGVNTNSQPLLPPFEYFYGGGYARLPSQPLEIEINGPGVCRFMGTAYDSFNLPLIDYEIYVDIYNGGDRSDYFSVFTASDGSVSFDGFPGQMDLYGSEGGFGFGQLYIDHCRLEDGSPGTDLDPRIIRLDGRFGGDFFYGGDQ